MNFLSINCMLSSMSKIQVNKKLYFSKKYLTIERFISYYHQVNLVLNEEPKMFLK
jgi:hypothetical protein